MFPDAKLETSGCRMQRQHLWGRKHFVFVFCICLCVQVWFFFFFSTADDAIKTSVGGDYCSSVALILEWIKWGTQRFSENVHQSGHTACLSNYHVRDMVKDAAAWPPLAPRLRYIVHRSLNVTPESSVSPETFSPVSIGLNTPKNKTKQNISLVEQQLFLNVLVCPRMGKKTW